MKKFSGVWCGNIVEATGSGFKFKTREYVKGWVPVTIFSEDGDYWRMKDGKEYEYEIIEKIAI